MENGNFDSLKRRILTVLKTGILTVWKEIFDSLEKENFDSLKMKILIVWKRNIMSFIK